MPLAAHRKQMGSVCHMIAPPCTVERVSSTQRALLVMLPSSWGLSTRSPCSAWNSSSESTLPSNMDPWRDPSSSLPLALLSPSDSLGSEKPSSALRLVRCLLCRIVSDCVGVGRRHVLGKERIKRTMESTMGEKRAPRRERGY